MLKKSLSALFTAVLLLSSLPAFAEHRHDQGPDRRWDNRGHGFVVHRLRPGYREIFWRGVNYLYLDGMFYRYSPVGYVIVEPPVGAIVPVLPPGYTIVRVQQTPYYYINDTYYVAASNGYAVASPPSVAPALPAATAPIVAPVSSDAKNEYKADIDTYDIYIPNSDGSFTLVTLKKAEKGFVGPQGELYPEHPTVEKLKVLYGKKS